MKAKPLHEGGETLLKNDKFTSVSSTQEKEKPSKSEQQTILQPNEIPKQIEPQPNQLMTDHQSNNDLRVGGDHVKEKPQNEGHEIINPEKKLSVSDASQASNIPASNVPLATLEEWHRRLDHISVEPLRKTLDQLGIKYKGSTLPSCDTCNLAKSKHAAALPVSSNTATQPLERICFDLSGKITPASLNAYRYFGVIGDQATKYVKVFFVKTKDQMPDEVIKWVKYIQKQTGWKVLIFRADNAGEHMLIFIYAEKNQIAIEKTVPGNSQQNGFAERMIQELQKQGRAALIESGAPRNLWAYAINYANVVYNSTAHKLARTADSTLKEWNIPSVLLCKTKVRLELIHPFGCLIYAHVDGASKLAPQAKLGAYLGPCKDRKGVMFYSPDNLKVQSTCNYKCDELTFPWFEASKLGGLRKALRVFEQDNSLNKGPITCEPAISDIDGTDVKDSKRPEANGTGIQPMSPTSPVICLKPEHASKSVVRTEPQSLEVKHNERKSQPEKSIEATSKNKPNSEVGGALVKINPNNKVMPNTENHYSLRSNRGVPGMRLVPQDWRKISMLVEETPDEEFVCSLQEIENENTKNVPLTYREAINSPEAEQWKTAMNKELEAFKKLKTYRIGTPPPGVNILNMRWIFSEKVIVEDKLEKTIKKARCVVKGYEQQPGVDYTQTKGRRSNQFNLSTHSSNCSNEKAQVNTTGRENSIFELTTQRENLGEST